MGSQLEGVGKCFGYKVCVGVKRNLSKSFIWYGALQWAKSNLNINLSNRFINGVVVNLRGSKWHLKICVEIGASLDLVKNLSKTHFDMSLGQKLEWVFFGVFSQILIVCLKLRKGWRCFKAFMHVTSTQDTIVFHSIPIRVLAGWAWQNNQTHHPQNSKLSGSGRLSGL